MRVRVARHTDDLEAIVAFYRDRDGLPEIARFGDHDGYDGVFLDVAELAERIGQPPVKPANPYWEARALTFADPDGCHLVLIGPRG
jgi:catechol 2,3-dioxygenase-like lactoylglutathione lyase family enzyme